MQLLQIGYRGLELLVELNVDRLAAVLVLATAIFMAAYLGQS